MKSILDRAGCTVALAVLLLSGCGPGTTGVVRSGPIAPGTLGGVDTVTWVGMDFRQAVFADKYMDPRRLVDEKLAIWNRRVLGDAIATAGTAFAVEPDLTVSERLLAEVSADQVKALDPTEAERQELRSRAARPVDPAAAEAAVEPFRDEAGGIGVLLVIDGAVKGVGTAGYWIVFDRASGEVHFTGRAVTGASGAGVLNYYGNGFGSLAEQAILDVKAAR